MAKIFKTNEKISESITIKKKSQAREIITRFLRNRTALLGLIIIVLMVFCALFPQIITHYDPIEQSLREQFIAPNSTHLFGTDEFGRDVFTRVVYGCRTSLLIGVTAVAISGVIGIILGCISGFYGGIADNLMMRGIDILMAVPIILLGMSIAAAFGQSVLNLTIAIAMASIAPYARLVRVSVLSVKEKEYVEAARATGANDLRIIMKYILPNCMAPIIVHATMNIASAILSATALSFLGLGVPAPTPEWGSMISAARAYVRDYWWLVTFPGIAIMAAVFSFNLFGDGLRDALDPKLKN